MGECGNSRRESSVLEICRNVRTGMRGVVTRGAISAWEVIGEYFGHLQYFGAPCRSGPANEGYRLRLKTKTTGIKHVRIDAPRRKQTTPSELLLQPVRPFPRGADRKELTVVAVTTRDVFPGEEVTVSYGNHLWFICRCGWWGCQHRELQDATREDYRSAQGALLLLRRLDGIRGNSGCREAREVNVRAADSGTAM
ncbi:hypothetical protein L917_02577 [Phytophthora nicotianae]|uniref:SET domain-containing protein n=1 Tax=Phytophthora nicotianae TaxID=4792 RepID=W2LTM8_PHYNI|nr:hypothetical protein L917_02577 [Phytophthora nicotianae]